MNAMISSTLKAALADSYALYLKTQNYHWNVEGPNFKSLHALFEDQYTDLAQAIDTIAELIRGLGEKSPGSFEAFKQTNIKSGNENAAAQTMVQELMQDNELIQKTLHTCLEAAQTASDEVVGDFMIQRLSAHRKATWMLKSSL